MTLASVFCSTMGVPGLIRTAGKPEDYSAVLLALLTTRKVEFCTSRRAIYHRRKPVPYAFDLLGKDQRALPLAVQFEQVEGVQDHVAVAAA